MPYLADATTDIAKRMREIRKEERRPDDNWLTAADGDLSAIGAAYGVERGLGESDYTYRTRVGDAISKRTSS